MTEDRQKIIYIVVSLHSGVESLHSLVYAVRRSDDQTLRDDNTAAYVTRAIS